MDKTAERSSKDRALRKPPKPSKLKLGQFGKRGVKTQFAALPYRITKKGKVKILLVTSRNRGRWILPKGWPMDGRTPARAAAQEAWEEGGVRGKAIHTCLGAFDYSKSRDPKRRFLALVYPLRVEKVAATWPEAKQRKRMWVEPNKAAKWVKNPSLLAILASFTPPDAALAQKI